MHKRGALFYTSFSEGDDLRSSEKKLQALRNHHTNNDVASLASITATDRASSRTLDLAAKSGAFKRWGRVIAPV